MIGQRTRKRLLTGGVLTCAMGLGALCGVGEARAQDLLQQPPAGTSQERSSTGDPQRDPQPLPSQEPLDSSGTGGAGETGTLPRDEDALDPATRGNSRNQGTTGMTEEPGTGRTDTARDRGTLDETGTGGSGTRGANEGMTNEPGTGGTGSAGDGSVRNSNED